MDLWSITSTRGRGTTVNGSCNTALGVVGKIPSETVTALFDETVGAIGLPQEQNVGSLERYLSGPGHCIIHNCWRSPGRTSDVNRHHHQSFGSRGGHLHLPGSHASSNGMFFFCFVVRCTTSLLSTGGRQKRGMLLSYLCKTYFDIAPHVALARRTTWSTATAAISGRFCFLVNKMIAEIF